MINLLSNCNAVNFLSRITAIKKVTISAIGVVNTFKSLLLQIMLKSSRFQVVVN
jgi:hypothetical protein